MKSQTINAQVDADWCSKASAAYERGLPLRLTGLTPQLLEEFLQCVKNPLPNGCATPLTFSLELAPESIR